MADASKQPVNAGDQVSNPIANLDATSNATLVRQMALLTEELKKGRYSTGDKVAIGGFLLMVPAFGGLALSSRIDRVEDRLGGQMNTLGAQVTRMDERLATIDGRLEGPPSSGPGKH